MTTALIIAGLLAWSAIGTALMVYDWTAKFDLDLGDALMCFFTGSFLGPIALIVVGISALSERDWPVLMRKRRSAR